MGIDPSGKDEDCSLYDFQCKEQVKNEEAPVDSGIITPITSTPPDDPLHFDPPGSTSTPTDPIQLNTPNMPDDVQPPETAKSGVNWLKVGTGVTIWIVVSIPAAAIIIGTIAAPEIAPELFVAYLIHSPHLIATVGMTIYGYSLGWQMIKQGVEGD